MVLGEGEEGVVRALRNLAAHKVLRVAGLNVYDILNYDEVLMTAKAARSLEARGECAGDSGVCGTMTDYNLIKSPLITEKGTVVNEKSNQVVFKVRPDATKGAIRDAVEELFKVTRAQGQDDQPDGQDAGGWDARWASGRIGKKLT